MNYLSRRSCSRCFSRLDVWVCVCVCTGHAYSIPYNSNRNSVRRFRDFRAFVLMVSNSFFFVFHREDPRVNFILVCEKSSKRIGDFRRRIAMCLENVLIYDQLPRIRVNGHALEDSRFAHEWRAFAGGDIISNRCGLSINTWRRTIAFSAGFVFITMPAGWLEKEPLIYFHSFLLPDPVSLVRSRFSYYYYYYYFQVKYTNM